jgi:sec-independent protein translocase protein TatB
MGGLGPGIGGFEILVIGLVALLVVGPKDLPMLMRKVGQFVAKARGMANDFRASFDEMARQTELDDLRKEVEALRSASGAYALGADADAAFKDIKTQLEAPLEAPTAAVSAPVETVETVETVATVATGVDEWPDVAPVEETASAEAAPVDAAVASVAKPASKKKADAKTKAKAATATKASVKVAAKPAAKRTKKVDQ